MLWQKKQTFLDLICPAPFTSSWAVSDFCEGSSENALEITFLVIFFSAIIGNYILNLIRMEDRPSLLPGEFCPKLVLEVPVLVPLILFRPKDDPSLKEIPLFFG